MPFEKAVVLPTCFLTMAGSLAPSLARGFLTHLSFDPSDAKRSEAMAALLRGPLPHGYFDSPGSLSPTAGIGSFPRHLLRLLPVTGFLQSGRFRHWPLGPMWDVHTEGLETPLT